MLRAENQREEKTIAAILSILSLCASPRLSSAEMCRPFFTFSFFFLSIFLLFLYLPNFHSYSLDARFSCTPSCQEQTKIPAKAFSHFVWFFFFKMATCPCDLERCWTCPEYTYKWVKRTHTLTHTFPACD